MLSASDGLAHAGSPGDDDEIARLHAGRHPVEIREAGGDAGDVGRIVAVVENLDPVDDAREQRADGDDLLGSPRALLGDVQHFRFCLVQHFLRTASKRVVGGVRDVAGRCRKLAQDRAVANDLRIVPDVRGGRHVADEDAEICEASDVVELLRRRERLGYGDDVGRLAVGDEAKDMLVDEPVRFAVEVRVGEHVAHLVRGFVIEQQPAQHRLLGLERVRGQLQRIELRIVGHGDERACGVGGGKRDCVSREDRILAGGPRSGLLHVLPEAPVRGHGDVDHPGRRQLQVRHQPNERFARGAGKPGVRPLLDADGR